MALWAAWYAAWLPLWFMLGVAYRIAVAMVFLDNTLFADITAAGEVTYTAAPMGLSAQAWLAVVPALLAPLLAIVAWISGRLLRVRGIAEFLVAFGFFHLGYNGTDFFPLPLTLGYYAVLVIATLAAISLVRPRPVIGP
jgi:hypothetical protein